MLDGMFNARRVAVVGVSNNPANAGRGIISNMIRLEYKGDIFPVGRSGGEIEGRPIYRAVDEIPGEIDLGVIMVPALFVAEALKACGQKGAKWAVIPSSGFGEYEDDRLALEEQLLTIARRYGMRFVGPNCLGIVNFATGLSTPFAPLFFEKLHKGPVSIVAQSGAVAQGLCSMISEYGPGVNKFISMGNKLNLDEVDFVDYLADDSSTDVICMYLEDIRRGRQLMDAARRCSKPVLVHKGGISAAGFRVAKSHTAALAVNNAVLDAAFRQAGLVRIQGMRKMAIASGVVRLPKLQGNRLAVITPSGGNSVIIGDLCEEHGFVLPPIDQQTLDDIEQNGRAGVIHLTNPLDLGDIWDGNVFVDSIRRVISLPYIDGAIVVFPLGSSISGMFGNGSDRVAAQIKEIGLKAGKPVVLSSMSGSVGITEVMHKLDYPIIVDPEDTVEAMVALLHYSRKH